MSRLGFRIAIEDCISTYDRYGASLRIVEDDALVDFRAASSVIVCSQRHDRLSV